MKSWATRSIGVVGLVCWALAGPARPDPLPSYYDRYYFLSAPPSTWGDGLVGFVNPANRGLLHKPEFRFYWAGEQQETWGFDDWGFYSGLPYLGFSVQSQNLPGGRITDYRLGLGGGSRAASMGIAYGWSSSGDQVGGREDVLVLGFVSRPGRFFSLGLTGNISLNSNASEWVGEIGLRPFGAPWFTVFADAAWPSHVGIEDVPWSAGAALRVFPGVSVVGRYFESEAFTVGLTFNIGRSGAITQSHFDNQQELSRQTWGVRVGRLKSGFTTSKLRRSKYYHPVQAQGRVRYLKYRFLDNGTPRFWDILNDIRTATEDHRVAVIAMKVSTLQVAPEHAWEIREALRQAQDAGKKIIVFIDNAGMNGYHLASVADHIVMDPQGMLMLPGYRLNRTYFKGSLAKLGLAFEEWRLFTYKSAAEALSREDMSAADREQNQAFVDDWYEQTRADVTGSRGLSEADWDALIDDRILFMPDSALAAGLVDTVARWSDLDKVVRSLHGRKLRGLGSDGLLKHALISERWGEEPRIALVYGLGACDLDRGIRARWLEKVFLKLANDRRVRAVVFRVDSPGGEALPSDLVAAAVRTCSRKKPVIVSQGQMAASGGYWISMYADSIIAGPTTVTGSIGVIGGWLYEDGIGEKLGMTSDLVQRGAHADYSAGIRLPLIGATIPRRNLTAEEREMVDETMRELYGQFVHKVARGRDLALNEVSRLGEGRIYSGIEGKKNGLVDEVGNLLFALEIARKKGHAGSWNDLRIVEYPRRRGLFSVPWSSNGVAEWAVEDPVIETARMLYDARGRPLPLVLPGSYPEVSD